MLEGVGVGVILVGVVIDVVWIKRREVRLNKFPRKLIAPSRCWNNF